MLFQPENSGDFVAQGNETPEAKPRTCWNAAAMPRPAKQDPRELHEKTAGDIKNDET